MDICTPRVGVHTCQSVATPHIFYVPIRGGVRGSPTTSTKNLTQRAGAAVPDVNSCTHCGWQQRLHKREIYFAVILSRTTPSPKFQDDTISDIHTFRLDGLPPQINVSKIVSSSPLHLLLSNWPPPRPLRLVNW